MNQDETEDVLTIGHHEIQESKWALGLVRPGLRLNDRTLSLFFFLSLSFMYVK